MTLRGPIVDGAPRVFVQIRRGILSFSARGGTPLVIDTGFAGSLAIPRTIARQLQLDFLGSASFTLATGVSAELPTYATSVRMGSRLFNTWCIIDDALIGMEFLQQVCSQVRLDLDDETVELVLRNERR